MMQSRGKQGASWHGPPQHYVHSRPARGPQPPTQAEGNTRHAMAAPGRRRAARAAGACKATTQGEQEKGEEELLPRSTRREEVRGHSRRQRVVIATLGASGPAPGPKGR
ncbi:unnamed protein product [Prorocentrum cordatum]|uniref:Uncharacterized protein n=1 Tax=Prorocentrum cordatum TaxID=2364126 RepID=A0ABN9S9W9_9DINO|nr:unnamed protein product [Polarella glacialis]